MQFEMDLIPLDSDVVTCALPHLIKSCVSDHDDQPLNQMARSLQKLQVLFARFGKFAAKVTFCFEELALRIFGAAHSSLFSNCAP